MLAPVVVGLALSLSLAPSAHGQARHSGPYANLESTVDIGIRPGDDFFSFANGGWLKATAIPAGKDRWGVRNEIDEVARQRVMQIIADASAAPEGTTARKVADFRAALLNEAAIEARGLMTIAPHLDSIDRLQDKVALTRMLGREMRADVDPLNWGIYRSASLLGLAVEESIHGEKANVAFLVQGGLGLPDREYYLSAEPAMQALRTRYRAFVGRMLGFAGAARAEQRADAVLALETAMAQTQATREASANDRNADTLWTPAEFARRAPGMDWPTFFAAAGLGSEGALVPWQPAAVKGLAALVASEPLEAWKDYLRLRELDTYADALPGELAREAAAFHDAVANADAHPSSRAERATNLTQLAMSDAIGKMYVDRYFPAEQKARVEKIVANVVAAFVRRLEAATWMDPGTRALALAKVRTLYIGIGYPEQDPDYSDLAVDPADAVGNLRRVAERNRRRARALLGTPVDMKQWWIVPQRANAILVFQQNAYEFAAALLQPPKFDPMASDAATYGAIGAIIGHDVVHFVDVLGAEYEVDGRMRRWWTPGDVERYTAVTASLVKQVAGYHPYPDVVLNGKLTLTENVADLGGLAAAFDAYRGTLGSRADPNDVRHHDREFFIAYAQGSRTRISESAMRTQAATNDHAPEMYRVSTVRNFDAWYDAFDVRPGDRLYLAPAARVRIW
ncbi:M13 family metallopeptidase [soil metagenome]